ncbi:MAG: FxDxF family PEP-CTERM protein [Phenylobacterium sp.]|jgi:opacity protein-like surface antigen|uniref:FxDxF family PEP-CTERM protein n=1 Tax=Phenylobacterium sp. TaxID=1871053 RepID=UPI00391D7D34
MKKLLMAAAAAVAMTAAAPAAHAAHVINFASPAADGSISGAFKHEGIAGGAFSDVYNFMWPSNGIAGGTISSSFQTSIFNDIDFTSVTLNGAEFQIGSTGQVEFRFLNDLLVTGGMQQLIVSGTSGGNGSYAGTLTFFPSAAIPEPATWAMMIAGFGLAGAALRRRRSEHLAFA